MIVIEFYPTPYGHDASVQVQAWQNMDEVLSALKVTTKAMYTGVRGPDRFFEAETDDIQGLKSMIEQTPKVESVEIAPVQVLGTTYERALRVHLPLPVIQARRRR